MAASTTTIDLKWYGKEVGEAAAKQMKSNAKRTGMFLSGKVVNSISKGQPVKRVGNRLVGLKPSKAGEPPRVLHNALRNSIDYRIDRDKKHVDVYIGASTPYARALEFGNPRAVTSLAGGMAGAGMPRPYLRPALKKHRDKAIDLLVRGLFKGTGRVRK